MLTPFPTQISGSRWLSSRHNALLADQPRVGKTGTAILACDDVLAASVLVVTTASGRAVWERAWADWSPFRRSVQVMTKPVPAAGDVVVVSWRGATSPEIRHELLRRRWDRLILDEAHAAKSFDAERTRAVYGEPVDDGVELLGRGALAAHAGATWALTGTPVPNAPDDLYPMMRALCPERLTARDGLPDVTRQSVFRDRYCIVRAKKVANRRIPVVVAGRNLEELRIRLDGFDLRRTQADVGIRPPVYETWPLLVPAALRREVDGDTDRGRVLAAAEAGDTRALKMELGPLRRHTGALKARVVAQAIEEELKAGLDQVVLAYWHTEVGRYLRDRLAPHGVVGIDGATPARTRADAVQRFRDGTARVFLGQIQAAGEAIDLSAASELVFAETSLVPKDMQQMSLRITNHTQARLPRVRVATLHGSIDATVEEILLRKWSAIREITRG